ncbi:uncharacterized protein LOC131247904 [Magnolia sinica]|uniref:uncharacterized protein LOC131247904 n=1 Tax=Magnolia sinica TaxID=86752 RepID=UPI00265A507E|nr:uncharacterized protein LOC131247904 [Magnolia sinica]XP_058103841.1 uncharacterized protein LOC131247904 [Magnolia sinica]XP_058103842.1 uncharacterized protein LOC131247904 [Magnolia sinica]XP_058103843.1 uncharacterized protein LOC131247904 [Magnolia sinica]XP_058103844.1 uncharacterized protein LOC131247904 [Magnolia sinica]XP_058103845.1 uncharacterized protein LOC131247904 [Magnolia sinica]
MGSFKGHLLPGTLFLAIGVWHIWSTIVRYVSDPKGFRVRVWNPVPWFGGRVKHLELYVIAGGALIDFCIELFYSTHLKFLVNGVLNPSHMNDFEHAGMLLMFLIFGVVALLNEKTRYISLPEGALCLIIATAFCSEYLLFYFHSTSHKGLEGYYHLLLVLVIGLCIVSTVAGALIPTSFPVDLSSGISITLQGLWFYQTAFTLYGPMMPAGCLLKDNEIKCRLPDNEVRGELLANFQLFTAVVVILIGAVGSYGIAASRYGHSELKSMHAAENGLQGN